MFCVLVKAWLDLKSLENLVVKAGQTARFDVKIGGEPAPDAFWYKNDKQLDQTPNISIEIKKQEHTVLCIKSAQRSDMGKYKLLVKNNLGEQEGTAELLVLGNINIKQ